MRTTRERQDMGIRTTASTEKWRDCAEATPRSRVTGQAWLHLLVTLFLASAMYVGFGGVPASELTPLPQPQTVTVADAANPADAEAAPSDDETDDETSIGSATLSGYLLARDVHRGRDDDGNLTTDEHR